MSFIGPELPSHLINPKNSENYDEHTEKGPQITPHLVQRSTLNIYDEDDDDGPELPPHLRKGSGKEAGSSMPTPPGPSTGKSQVQVGPTFPSYAPTYDPATYHNSEDDDDDDDFGPKPLPAGMQHQKTDAVKEFIEREEKRRKLAEVCSKHLFYNFILFYCHALFSTLIRMLPNPRVFNETNGCLSHHHHQVFSEVSSTCRHSVF